MIYVITGAASGIGRAWATELASPEATLFLLDIQNESLATLATQLEAKGAKVETHLLDVTDADKFTQLIRSIWNDCGPIDVLFNNAGIGIVGDASQFTSEDWIRQSSVNFIGVCNGIHAVYPLMKERGTGQIVNTASMAGLMIMPGMALYSATKHAVVSLTKALSIEAETSGVWFTVVCPGAIQTPILEGGMFGGVRGYSREAAKELTKTWLPMSVEKFARKSLKKIFQKKKLVIVPSWCRILWVFRCVMPMFLEMMIIRMIHRNNLRILAKAEDSLQVTQTD